VSTLTDNDGIHEDNGHSTAVLPTDLEPELQTNTKGKHPMRKDSQSRHPNSDSISVPYYKSSRIGPLRGFWHRHVRLPLIRFFENTLMRQEAEKFYLYFGGHIFFETLRSAVKFDLFTLLDEKGPLTRSEIAKHLGIEEQPARILLLGLTVGGLIKKKKDRYNNSRLSKQLLTKGSSRRVLQYVELEHSVMYKPMHRFFDALQAYDNVGLEEFKGKEPTVYERLAHYPDLETIFQDAMQELSVQSNEDLALFVNFSRVNHVVDVGGGDGTNAIALAARWPHLRITVFDSPTVCEIAVENIAKHDLQDRIKTCQGNCFDSPFPEDADCFLFAHFMTIWSCEKDQQLFEKAYVALPKGGQVLIYNMMQDDDESGPWAAAIGSPYFLTVATGEGMLYTWSEYEAWMQAAGFQNVQRTKLPRHHGVIVGYKM
jgi:ubiquinone/menaquinone biosynthesis C-methylase UbiE/predicted transcriptional regulator